MSEYREPHTVSRLFGSPPGYVGYDQGGQLTEAVRRRPYQVILFDEVEKAHPEVLSALLQILDDGRLTDGHGRTVDFRNTVVIMTSNVGSIEAYSKRRDTLGFQVGNATSAEAAAEQAIEKRLRAALKRDLPAGVPEPHRRDHRLPSAAQGEPAARGREDAARPARPPRRAQADARADATRRASGWSSNGYDDEYGARPLRRLIQREVENPLAKQVLAGEYQEGDAVLVDVSADDALTFTRRAGERLETSSVPVAA